MASGPITSWQRDGETMETVRDFIFGGSTITADVDCSHEIKRCLLLGASLVAQMVKASAYNAGDLSLIPGSGRSLEKEMATHSSTLAWKIPWMEEQDGLQSMGSQS